MLYSDGALIGREFPFISFSLDDKGRLRGGALRPRLLRCDYLPDY